MKRKPISCFLICFFSICIVYTQSTNDSLRSIWVNKNEMDSVRFNSLAQYYKINNQAQPDSTLVMLDYYQTLAKEKNNIKQLYHVANDKGGIYRLKGKYQLAMEYYNEAQRIAVKLKDSLLQAANFGNKGNVFFYQQNYKKATQSFSQALNIYRNIENEKGESNMLSSLGNIYLTIQNYELALQYYDKALSLLKNNSADKRRTGIIFINKGWTYYELKNYKEAKHYYKKGLKIVEATNDKFFMISCYSTLAKIYLKLNDFKTAKFYAQKDLKLSKELNIRSYSINSEIIFAKLAYHKNIEKATNKAENILANLPKQLSKDIKIELYQFLYQCYKAQNKTDKSLEMFEMFTVYNDSIQQEKKNFSVVREALKNEYESKLYESNLENEKKKEQLENSQLKRIITIIIIAILTVISLIVYFVTISKRNRKHRDKLLEEIKNLQTNNNSKLIVNPETFELIREKIEATINRNLNETDWKVLNILLNQPEITNKEIAQRAFMSVDGIGSSLRRMYDYFEIKDTKYKKIALLTEAIRRSEN